MRYYKPLFHTVICMLVFNSVVFSQALTKGKLAFNAYYGTNLFTTALKVAYIKADQAIPQTDVKIGGGGTVGFSGEYMVSDLVGVGLDFNYANSYVSWKETKNDNNNILKTFSYRLDVPRFMILPRANFHLTNSEDFDFYIISGLGFKNYAAKFTVDDPNFEKDLKVNAGAFSFKAGLGFRYFFTQNIGLNAEMAVGTPFLSGGISARF